MQSPYGDLGNADILYVTGQLDDNWICGLPQDAQTPGLMVGLAGIGFGLLRFWSPQEIPSVVSLDKPVK